MSGQGASAGRLEQRDVPPGLNVALLLQPGQRRRSEEDLREDRTPGSDGSVWRQGQSGHADVAANICHMEKKQSFNLRCISGVPTESIRISDKGARRNGHVPTRHLTISQNSQYPITPDHPAAMATSPTAAGNEGRLAFLSAFKLPHLFCNAQRSHDGGGGTPRLKSRSCRVFPRAHEQSFHI